jgi:GrpB-like predicted nucleotidyltransferase (UPF0157 family)
MDVRRSNSIWNLSKKIPSLTVSNEVVEWLIIVKELETTMIFLPENQFKTLNDAVFEQIATVLRKELPEAAIEHIGSSSVEGLCSKGDLDILVAIDSEEFDLATNKIQGLGFNIKQETLRTDCLCPFESNDYEMDVGIQLIVNESEFEFFRTFRDALKANADLRNRYNELKFKCEGMNEHQYREIKSKFIEDVLAKIDKP